MSNYLNPHFRQAGFSLIELAIVLFIVALLLGGLLVPLSAQIDQQRTNETQKMLAEIKDALIGYAVVYGRLPCPASDTSNGAESFDAGASGDASNGLCSNFYNGFVPAATLGFTTGVDNQGRRGFAVDAWNNRIRYAVTVSNANAFTKTNGMSANFSTLAPDLIVCTVASANPSSCSVANSSLTSSPGVPVIIFSTGKNGAYGGTGADETENLDNDKIFVSHTGTQSPNEFDDFVIWLSPNILINRMVTAGKLP